MPKYKLNMVVDAWQFDGTPQSGVAIEEATKGAVMLNRSALGNWFMSVTSTLDAVEAGEWVVAMHSDYFVVHDDDFKSLYVPVKDTKSKD